MSHNIISSFQNAMILAGLPCSAEIIPDGKFHSFGLPDDRGKKPCRYILHLFPNGLALGYYKDWRRDIEGKWCNREAKNLTSQDRDLIKQKLDQLEKTLQETQTEAKKVAQYIWEHAQQNFAEHAYLNRKGVKNHGLRLYKGNLLVPLHNEKNELSSLQFINTNGDKWFKKYAPTKSCFFLIGEAGEVIYVTEGYATAATIHKASGCSVIVAFNANNLLPVAQIIRKKYPDKSIVICADNDAFNPIGNIGVQKSTEAAQAVNAKVVIPQFKDVTTKPTDFNDLMQLEGVEEIRLQINNAITPKETFEEAIARVSKLSPMLYEQVRKIEAKKLNVRVGALDQFAKPQKQTTTQNTIAHELENGIEAWPEPVNAADLAQELKALFDKHVILNEWQIIALVLWVFGTYCFDAFSIFPKLLLTSPTKRCGKTTLMRILNCVTNRALMVSNTSAAAIFRAVDSWQPTLLIDEGDTFIKNNEELRGIINSGHTKDTAFVLRVEGDSNNRTPKRFSTWSPMAIAMIKHPPETILDRSIIINLRRKSENERTSKLAIDCFIQLKVMRQKLKRWADDNLEIMKNSKPQIPKTGSDRATDNWLPLFAVATLLGTEWVNAATIAIQNLTSVDNEESIATMLLCDIRDIFETAGMAKICSEDLVAKLIALEDRPWVECRNGTPMTKNTLARMLKPFGIKSKQIWMNYRNKQGYELADFKDAFTRYIPPIQNPRTLDANTGAAFQPIQSPRQNSSLGFQNSCQPSAGAEPRALGFQKGVTEEDNQREVIAI